MKKRTMLSLCLLFVYTFIFGQYLQPSSCLDEDILEAMEFHIPNIQEELESNEAFIQKIIKEKKTNPEAYHRNNPYIIPVVLHVFHDGNLGKISLQQAQSGIDVMNEDFNGMNDQWNNIDPLFDPIKGTLDIKFCLASIDPEGNPTTGVLYYEDADAVYNNNLNIPDYAWDNYKYLNIYLPKYAFDPSSNFTAFAYYPSTSNSNQNGDGIMYSSVRWGFGEHSQLTPGEDWASVGTHEAGHWLDLRHTFQGACSSSGDFVNDTPPTTGGQINFEGCYTNDFSCGVATNGSNFMDYNHACKKMFTQGQIERMEAALYLPSRITLWSEENLIATGCLELPLSNEVIANTANVKVYPNPANEVIQFELLNLVNQLSIYNTNGQCILKKSVLESNFTIDVNNFNSGIYFYSLQSNQNAFTGKFIIE